MVFRSNDPANQQSDPANRDSAEAQSKKDMIFKQPKEIEDFKITIDGLLVPYFRFSVIKNKKSEEFIVIVNLKLHPRHLHPSRGY